LDIRQPGQTGRYDVFIWNRAANTMRRVTDDSWSNYWAVGMSGDGSTVVFASDNPDLVPGDTNGTLDVFLVDTAGGPITRVSPGEGGGSSVGVSDEGQTVVYEQGWVDEDGRSHGRLLVWDRATGATAQVVEGNGEMFVFDLTDDGSRVAFLSWASDLVPGDTNEAADLFVADVTSGSVTRIESGIGEHWGASISGDGSALTFASSTTALVPPGEADTNGGADVFRVDLGSLDVVRLTNGNRPSNATPTISDDGRIIAFGSTATDLASGERDLDENDDVFLWNADTGLISRLTRSRERPAYGSFYPVVSGDGRTVAFNSGASDLAPGATPVDGAFWYAYVWTRTD
jgi:Tol biopolymer transport system component